MGIRLTYKEYYEMLKSRNMSFAFREKPIGYGMSSMADIRRYSHFYGADNHFHPECYEFELKPWSERAKEMKEYLNSIKEQSNE